MLVFGVIGATIAILGFLLTVAGVIYAHGQIMGNLKAKDANDELHRKELKEEIKEFKAEVKSDIKDLKREVVDLKLADARRPGETHLRLATMPGIGSGGE